MMDYKENYKGYEIQLTGTGKGWEYHIPKVLGFRPTMLYTKQQTALETAKGVIDRLMTE